MSKAKMLVLSFLTNQPMYGYQLAQIVEQRRIPAWAGVKQAAIYKAMQSLEAGKLIRGEEVREGNNPPRTVYHISPKGKSYLRQLILKSLEDCGKMGLDWWLVLSMSRNCLTREEVLTALDKRMQLMKQILTKKIKGKECLKMHPVGEAPFMHEHLMKLGERIVRAEEQTMQEIKKAVENGNFDGLFNVGESK